MKQLKPGDIILVHSGTSFISRGITYFMKIYKKRNKIKNIKSYTHAGTIIDVWGNLYVAESNAKGYQISKLLDAYNEVAWNKRIDVIEPVIPYTKEECETISKLLANTSFKINRYDYFNFLFQIYLVYTNKWIGPKGQKAENRFYCSEAAATLANKVRPNTFAKPALTNPVDIAINTNFKMK